MTKRLKKRLKGIVLALVVLCATTMSVLAFTKVNTGLFVMQAFTNRINAGNIQENTISTSEETNIATAQAEIPITAPIFYSDKTYKDTDGAIVCESLLQGIRDCDLPDSNNDYYVFRVKGKYKNSSGVWIEETKDYNVEIKNVYGNTTYTSSVSLGDATTQHKLLIVKYHGDLTINSNITVTATCVGSLTYKKGMHLVVEGNFKNYGTISMTARGTYNAAGENVYLWKNTDGTFEYIPATGGAGASAQQISSSANRGISKGGLTGGAGTNRALGGGGSGALTIWRSINGVIAKTAAGGTATSYSGGPGSRCSIYA